MIIYQRKGRLIKQKIARIDLMYRCGYRIGRMVGRNEDPRTISIMLFSFATGILYQWLSRL